MKKVTYNMYSCDICCMSREIIKTDGRNGAKCRKSKLRDMIGINVIVNDNKDEIGNSVVSYIKKGSQKREKKGEMQ